MAWSPEGASIASDIQSLQHTSNTPHTLRSSGRALTALQPRLHGFPNAGTRRQGLRGAEKPGGCRACRLPWCFVWLSIPAKKKKTLSTTGGISRGGLPVCGGEPCGAKGSRSQDGRDLPCHAPVAVPPHSDPLHGPSYHSQCLWFCHALSKEGTGPPHYHQAFSSYSLILMKTRCLLTLHSYIDIYACKKNAIHLLESHATT